MAPASGAVKNGSNIGPYFLGQEFSLVDITLVPWFIRIQSVLKHYRQFEIPSGKWRQRTYLYHMTALAEKFQTITQFNMSINLMNG